MHARLFSAPLAQADYEAYGAAIGLDADRFSACLRSSRALGILADHRALAKRLNIRATPTFLIGILQANGSIAVTRRVNGGLDTREFVYEVRRVEVN